MVSVNIRTRSEVGVNFHSETLGKVGLPLGIVRIRCTLNLYVPFDRHVLGAEEVTSRGHAMTVNRLAAEDPPSGANCREIAFLYPPGPFLWMSSFCPAPQCF